MEDIEEMYIIKLLTGSTTIDGRFLANDNNNNRYGANQVIYHDCQNIFNDFEGNGNEKFAVVVDEVRGPGKWEGYVFRNIQFISSNKDFCEKYKHLKTKEEQKKYEKIDLIEKMIRTHQDASEILKLEKQLLILEEELNVMRIKFEELHRDNT